MHPVGRTCQGVYGTRIDRHSNFVERLFNFIVGQQDWRAWCKGGARQANVPVDPQHTYKDAGWRGWRHWLGTSSASDGSAGAQQAAAFLPFGDALAVARAQKLTGEADWKAWCSNDMRPANVPASPDQTYTHVGWRGWPHWLGTSSPTAAAGEAPAVGAATGTGATKRSAHRPGGKQASQYLPFAEALVVVRAKKLKNQPAWREWGRSGTRPANLPSEPGKFYAKDGWQGLAHFLGYASSRSTSSRDAAGQTTRRPAGGSSNQHKKQKDWGTRHPASQFLPFGEAAVLARTLALGSKLEWEAWSGSGSRPANVPSTPHATYKYSGWQGWGHWLGTGNTGNAARSGEPNKFTGKQHTAQFLPFGEAVVLARSLRLPGVHCWKEWEQLKSSGARPANLPSRPDIHYKHDGWQGFAHFLGADTQATPRVVCPSVPRPRIQFLPFEEALLVVRSLQLTSQKDWTVWSSSGMRPANIPGSPWTIYKHAGWQSIPHWLGYDYKPSRSTRPTGRTGHQFMPFQEALAVARAQRLSSQNEWRQWCSSGRRPATMPYEPSAVYKGEGWQGFGHWLGTGNRSTKPTNTTMSSRFLPFDKALAMARSLNLANQFEWDAWKRSGARQSDLPGRPDLIYKHDGWQGLAHWLGTSSERGATASTASKVPKTAGCGIKDERLGDRPFDAASRGARVPAGDPGDPTRKPGAVQFDQARLVRKATRSLTKRLGRAPTESEVAGKVRRLKRRLAAKAKEALRGTSTTSPTGPLPFAQCPTQPSVVLGPEEHSFDNFEVNVDVEGMPEDEAEHPRLAKRRADPDAAAGGEGGGQRGDADSPHDGDRPASYYTNFRVKRFAGLDSLGDKYRAAWL